MYRTQIYNTQINEKVSIFQVGLKQKNLYLQAQELFSGPLTAERTIKTNRNYRIAVSDETWRSFFGFGAFGSGGQPNRLNKNHLLFVEL